MNLVGATSSFVPGVAGLAQEVQVTMQPLGGSLAGNSRVEVFQNSGSWLRTIQDGIDTPSLMGTWLTNGSP